MTINKRANDYASEHLGKVVNADMAHLYNELGEAYIKGATDQQKIDIEKACEALYKIQDLLNADLMDIEKAKDIMTKAMEEQA